MISLHRVSTGYRGKKVLKEISLELDKSLTVVLGPNGAGKTTLFRLCCGILKPYSGSVTINGHDVHNEPSVKRLIGYLPHADGLIGEVSVLENLLFYSKIYGMDRTNALKKIKELSERFEFEDLLNLKVWSLSHGQKKRVALARTLLNEPEVLFLDEPTEGLDPLIAKKFREFVKEAEKEISVVYSTHNLYEAVELAKEVCALDNGQVVFQGSLEKLKDFVGNIRIGIKTGGSPAKALKVLSSLGYQVTDSDEMWIINVKSEEEIGQVVSELTKNGIPVLRVREVGNVLERFLEKLKEEGGSNVR
jgi:ABC-type multidrug transport system ATPase subunit